LIRAEEQKAAPLLGTIGSRNNVARNLANEIEKLLAGFNLIGQKRPRFLE